VSRSQVRRIREKPDGKAFCSATEAFVRNSADLPPGAGMPHRRQEDPKRRNGSLRKTAPQGAGVRGAWKLRKSCVRQPTLWRDPPGRVLTCYGSRGPFPGGTVSLRKRSLRS
jgi:hypothetical protein